MSIQLLRQYNNFDTQTGTQIINSTTDTTVAGGEGSLIVNGGVSISKSLFVGQNIYSNGLPLFSKIFFNSTLSCSALASPLPNRTCIITRNGDVINFQYPDQNNGTTTLPTGTYDIVFDVRLPFGYYPTSYNVSCPIICENNGTYETCILNVDTTGLVKILFPNILNGIIGTTIGGFNCSYIFN